MLFHNETAMPDPSARALAFSSHDHARCAARAMAAVEAACAERRLRLTPVRRRTMELLLESHRALGAYQVLDRLSADGLGHQPPVAYRALDFLVEHGFAHRIESLNAFVACQYGHGRQAGPDHPGSAGPRTAHTPAFLICRTCHLVAEAETDAAPAPIDGAAAEAGFIIEHRMVEVAGLCPACRTPTS
jgi:Fur family zinc uptake transcriptional regulator